MGLFDALKGEARRIFIARPDDAKNEILWKNPDTNIRTESQLTVEMDEVCLFFKDGKIAGKLEAGRHTLNSQNIPFLGMLVDAVTGGNLFVSEIFFVTTREMASQKFGGPIGAVRDPETTFPVNMMCYGDFSIRCLDPEKLVVGLVGLRKTSNGEVFDWFKSQLMKTVKDHIAEYLVKAKMPLLDVTSGAYTEEIEEGVLLKAKKHIEPYGMTVVRLGDFNITVKPEDEERLKKFSTDKAYTQMAGGFNNYAQGAMMMGAGEGMSKGGSGGGAGLEGAGLGMGMAVAANMMNRPQQAPAPVATPVAAPAVGTMACPKCGASASGKFCAACGNPLPVAAAKRFCASCGTELPAGGKFCANCGTSAA